MSSLPPSSPSTIASDSEDNQSNNSSQSIHTLRRYPKADAMPDSETDNGSFGSPLQRFSKEMINTLSKYKVSDDLTYSNYPTWSQSIKEVFVSMQLDKYIKIQDYSDTSISSDKNDIIAFNLTTFILNRLDDQNNSQVRNHLTDSQDPTEIKYDPFLCWEFLKTRHNEITEDKLTAVTKALLSCKILKGDTLTVYLDKFENLVGEYYYYKGQMTDTQSARMLILSIPTLSETTIELIHATVKPLSRKGVSDYLRQYEQRHDWSSNAIQEANGASACQVQKKSSGSRCSETECVGPHPAKECWSKPINFEKRDKFLSQRRTQNMSSSNNQQTSAIRGMKKVNRPAAHATTVEDALIFHTTYTDQSCEVAAVKGGDEDWALHDTGATHHVFKDEKFFKKRELRTLDRLRQKTETCWGRCIAECKRAGNCDSQGGRWYHVRTHQLFVGT